MKQLAIFLCLIAVLLTASASSASDADIEPGMIDAIQAYSTALYSQDAEKAASATCQQDVAGLEKAITVSNLGAALFSGTYDASGIVFTVEKRVGDVVQLRIVSGKGKMNAVILETPQPVDILPPIQNNLVILKHENGAWKVCLSAASVLNAAAAQSAEPSARVANIAGMLRVGLFALSGLVMVFSGGRLARTASRALQTDHAIEEKGITAQAEIMERGAQSRVTYRYSVVQRDGETKVVTRQAPVKSLDTHALKVGDHFQVRYLPDDPEAHRIAGGAKAMTASPTSTRIAGFVLIIIGLLAVALAVLILFQ